MSRLPFPSEAAPEEKVWSVGALTLRIKEVLEKGFPPLWVEGEISNFTHHSSGHMYFSLKDDRAQLRAVFFRGQNRHLRFRPEDGLQVRAFGEITVYERSGQYQILVRRLLPVGTGELELAFRQLKERLEKEGLFRRERKKPLPLFPRRIGVITSPTGAAIHDIIRVLEERFPVELLLYPVRVQGEGAAEEIARAVARMNQAGGVDLLIVGRGGGSLEDLWAFNEEVVARAIAASDLPVVSAVGHEVDVTISDLVADLRAATPSAAAELVTPEREEMEVLFERQRRTIAARTEAVLRLWRERLLRFRESRALARPEAIVREEAQRTDDLARRLSLAFRHRGERLSETVRALSGSLRALDPLAVLERGYCVCRVGGEGPALTDASGVEPGVLLRLQFRRGEVDARAEEVRPEKKEGRR